MQPRVQKPYRGPVAFLPLTNRGRGTAPRPGWIAAGRGGAQFRGLGRPVRKEKPRITGSVRSPAGPSCILGHRLGVRTSSASERIGGEARSSWPWFTSRGHRRSSSALDGGNFNAVRPRRSSADSAVDGGVGARTDLPDRSNTTRAPPAGRARSCRRCPRTSRASDGPRRAFGRRIMDGRRGGLALWCGAVRIGACRSECMPCPA